ncbi:MAG: DUF4922 domain-containing protein [Muribaculum sp.]|nr:DUF4922 domain-containing protein [Muribaculum sp.]
MEDLRDFVELQLERWPFAAANYHGLGATERRTFMLGDFPCAVQYNPARIRSTGAKVDAKSIGERPCFLCKNNRPDEQISGIAIEGWELLVNPYPIFPLHFTIPSMSHDPQGELPLEMAALAEKWPGMAIFFNGARAGASAPDHAHMQMVGKWELPIVALTEKIHHSARGGIVDSVVLAAEQGLSLPFAWKSAVITPDLEGMKTLAALPNIYGVDAETGEPDRGLVNAIMWIGSDRLLRAVIIPRKRHRPACYYAGEDEKMLVSPGTIDMAGVIILPRREDFDRITPEDVASIYGEV